MAADIKERISSSTDEEILKMLTTHFPDYRKEWIDISQEELTKRGFVLKPTEAELIVTMPSGQKLVYPKIKTDVRAIAQMKIESNYTPVNRTKRIVLLITVTIAWVFTTVLLRRLVGVSLGLFILAILWGLVWTFTSERKS